MKASLPSPEILAEQEPLVVGRGNSSPMPGLYLLTHFVSKEEAETQRVSFSGKLMAYLELTKPRINSLIVLVAAAGFWLASGGSPDHSLLAGTLIGISLLGGGIFALNQYLERDIDALMRRTDDRPLPTGRLEPREALWFGALLSIVAIAVLSWHVNLLSGLLALMTLGSYLFLYTPLKTKTPLCTFLGAFPGAVPPLLGWVSACGELSVEGWVLFSILFFWQFPHFLSIAWLYRDDYERAGIRMLPVVEPDGKTTGRQIILFTTLLVLASLLPVAVGLTGQVYFWGALVLGILFLYLGVKLALLKSKWHARRVLLASVFYLPLLFALMVVNPSRLWGG